MRILSRGFCLFEVGRYDDAVLAYTTSLEIDEKNPHAWFYKGRAHISLDN